MKCQKCGYQGCEKEFKSVRKKRFCSQTCAGLARVMRSGPDAYDRPYTKDTARLIRRWHKSGDSIESIAILLRRSPDNIRKALEVSREAE